LADEIAQAENALRLYSCQELETVDASYEASTVVLVASPSRPTEGKVLALSTAIGRSPAVGIIRGSTLEQARALWQRGASVRSGSGYVASAPDVDAKLDAGRIWELSASSI
jgi:hypothetical protein